MECLYPGSAGIASHKSDTPAILLHIGIDTTVFSRHDEVPGAGQLVGEQKLHHVVRGQTQCIHHLWGQEVSVLADHILSVI